MIPLLNYDLNKVLSRVPEHVRNLMQKEGLILAGGFVKGVIAGEKVSDIDLFGDTSEHLHNCAQELMRVMAINRAHHTQFAITLPSFPPVQFITRWTYQNAEDVIKSFDFTICQAAIWWVPDNETVKGMWISSCSDRFYPDLAARRLYYTNPIREEEAGGSMLRVRKYLKRGYNIQVESLGNVIGRIVEKVNMERAKESPLTIGEIVQGLLREVDPRVRIDGTVEED